MTTRKKKKKDVLQSLKEQGKRQFLEEHPPNTECM